MTAHDPTHHAIVFLKTAKGAWMPVDAESISPEDELYEPRSEHVSHFDTCDDPEWFRRAGSR